MLVLNADQIRALAPMNQLVESLRKAFGASRIKTARTPTPMPGGSGDRLFLSMLAMDPEIGTVIKAVTILPDNRAKGLLTVQGAIVVFSETGAPEAVLDGTIITQLRTGAASALASDYLSCQDSSHLVILGTGALAPNMAAAHCAVRPIKRISVWGRRPDAVTATIASIKSRVPAVTVDACRSLAESVATADIVSCSTSSADPILAGKWLKPGAHVDLVGSYQAHKRETDDDVVLRSRIFVDTFDGALHEGGDVVEPLSRGIIKRERIEGQLADLVSGRVVGRKNDSEITLFKSVGTAIEDFAAARLVVEAAAAKGI